MVGAVGAVSAPPPQAVRINAQQRIINLALNQFKCISILNSIVCLWTSPVQCFLSAGGRYECAETGKCGEP
jgi:hypothetical protein